MKVFFFIAFAIAGVWADGSLSKEVNLTDGVLSVNGEVIEFPELPNPEALTAADIEKFTTFVATLKNAMEALENTLYIYDKVKEYITEVKKRIDEFLINNPKFISEVKEFFNKIAKYLRLKKDQLEKAEGNTKTKRDVRMIEENEKLKQQIKDFSARLKKIVEELAQKSQEEIGQLSKEDFKHYFEELFGIEHKNIQERSKRDLKEVAKWFQNAAAFFNRLDILIGEYSTMSKSEIEKFTVEDFERDLEWLFGIKHKQNDLAKTKPKTNSGKMSTVSWSEDLDNFLAKLRKFLEKFAYMSREELENMTVEEFEQLFNTIFGIEHEFQTQNNYAEVDDKIISYIKSAK